MAPNKDRNNKNPSSHPNTSAKTPRSVQSSSASLPGTSPNHSPRRLPTDVPPIVTQLPSISTRPSKHAHSASPQVEKKRPRISEQPKLRALRPMKKITIVAGGGQSPNDQYTPTNSTPKSLWSALSPTTIASPKHAVISKSSLTGALKQQQEQRAPDGQAGDAHTTKPKGNVNWGTTSGNRVLARVHTRVLSSQEYDRTAPQRGTDRSVEPEQPSRQAFYRLSNRAFDAQNTITNLLPDDEEDMVADTMRLDLNVKPRAPPTEPGLKGVVYEGTEEKNVRREAAKRKKIDKIVANMKPGKTKLDIISLRKQLKDKGDEYFQTLEGQAHVERMQKLAYEAGPPMIRRRRKVKFPTDKDGKPILYPWQEE